MNKIEWHYTPKTKSSPEINNIKNKKTTQNVNPALQQYIGDDNNNKRILQEPMLEAPNLFNNYFQMKNNQKKNNKLN